MKNEKLKKASAELAGMLLGILILSVLGGWLLSVSVEQLSFFQGMGVVSAIGCAVRIGSR